MKIDPAIFYHNIEDETLEYKEGFDNDDIASTVASFSTSKGGFILIGVKNNGTPLGYKCVKEKLTSKLLSIARDLSGGAGSLEMHFVPHSPNKYVIVVRVHEGDKKPYGWKGVYYERIDSSDVKLDPKRITELQLKAANLTFDELKATIYDRSANISDLDESELVNYTTEANASKRNKSLQFVDPEHFLKNLDLFIQDKHLKNSALLMFGKDSEAAFPNSKINFLTYSGDTIDSSTLKSKKWINGTLKTQIDKAYELIKLSTENRVVMQGLKRLEINQYPLKAIREGIINAVVHRDYSIFDAQITIRLFENRLEIISPGGPPEGVDIDELQKGGHHSVRRNRSVCALFDNIGYMERSGQGIKVMINAMKDMGLDPPKITPTKSSFRLEFTGQKVGNKKIEFIHSSTDLALELTTKQTKGLKYITNMVKNTITISGYMKAVKIKSRVTAKRHLTKFENLRILKSKKDGNMLVYTKST